MIRLDQANILREILRTSVLVDAIKAVVESEVEMLYPRLRAEIRDGNIGSAQRLQGTMEGLEKVIPAIESAVKAYAPDRE